MATGRIEMSLDREGTSMSMVSNHSHLSRRSHNSQISQYGPLSRQALQRHTKVRVKSSKGTRYVIKFNSVRFKVETIDDGHESDHSIVDRSHRQKRSRTHWGHFRRSKTDPELLRFGYTMRPTASGLCDPWVDLEMDKKILPKIEDKPLVASSFESPRPKPKKTPRTSKKGSTMCPQFPVVTMPVREWETKALNYMDVPDMRHQLDKRFMKINNKDKTNVEYVRTKEDFYRMELNKLNEVHPSNRSRIKRTYEAYLRNTPGSRQAIQECLKNTKVPSKHAQAH